MVTVTNALSSESRYFNAIQTIEQWPRIHTEMVLKLDDAYKIKTIPKKNFDSIEDYIAKSKENGLTVLLFINSIEFTGDGSIFDNTE